jgi:hypothetical protein
LSNIVITGSNSKTQDYRKEHFSTDLQEREIEEDQRKDGETQCEDVTGKCLIHGVKKKMMRDFFTQKSLGCRRMRSNAWERKEINIKF